MKFLITIVATFFICSSAEVTSALRGLNTAAPTDNPTNSPSEHIRPLRYYQTMFKSYTSRMSLSFSNDTEYTHRLKVFTKNLDFIAQSNANPANTFVLGLTKFAHLTSTEYKAVVRLGGYKKSSNSLKSKTSKKHAEGQLENAREKDNKDLQYQYYYGTYYSNPTYKPTVRAKPTRKPTTKPTIKSPPTLKPVTKPSPKVPTKKPISPTKQPIIVTPPTVPRSPTGKPVIITPPTVPKSPTGKPITVAPPTVPKSPTVQPVAVNPPTTPATSVDWSPVLGPVKDQGNCGSCWAFSAVSALEGAYYLKYGVLNHFSEQQVVSCDTANGNAGCNGGYENTVWDWINTQGGLTLNSNYPYTSGTTGSNGVCNKNIVKDPNTISKSTVLVQPNSPSALMNAIAGRPVSIAVAASTNIFQFYVSGTVNSASCGTALDHAILAVGYGVDAKGVPYIRCKNQWGSGWGDNGYINIAATSANICGILSDAAYPVL